MEQLYSEQVQDAAKALDGITDEIEERKKQMDSNNEQLILKVRTLSCYFQDIIMPLYRKIGGILLYRCSSVRLSVCLSAQT